MAVDLGADQLAREDLQPVRRRPRHRRHPRRIARHRHGLEVIGAEDRHLVVLRGKAGVDRDMQHHVGRTRAKVMPAPDHVAQVVVHVLAGLELDELGAQAELLGERLAQRDIDALALLRVRRKVRIDGDAQRARLLGVGEAVGGDGARDARQGGLGDQRAHPEQHAAAIIPHGPSPARRGWPTWPPGSACLRRAACTPRRCGSRRGGCGR